jgi:dynein heavy chain
LTNDDEVENVRLSSFLLAVQDIIFYIFRYADLLLRIKELESWTSDFSLPSSVWLSGFFNPQSFLTAIMQSTARKNELPLDKMSLTCEVSKKYPGESMQVPRDGAYVHGLFIEGARWVLFFLNITFV